MGIKEQIMDVLKIVSTLSSESFKSVKE